MDGSSSAMTITRGMSLHVNVLDNPPSFWIGLTHDFGVSAGSAEKFKLVQSEKSIEELISKKK